MCSTVRLLKYGFPQHTLGLLKDFRLRIGKNPEDAVTITLAESKLTGNAPAKRPSEKLEIRSPPNRNSALLDDRLPSETLWMISSRETAQIGNLNEHTCAYMADGKLIVADEVVECPAANGEHLCGLVSADQEFLILRDRDAAGTLAFGDVYFSHWRTPWGSCSIE